MQTRNEIYIMNEQYVKSYFLICKLCYWCASYVNIVVERNRITKCPDCNDGFIKYLPIRVSESYKFNYAEKRNNSLQFGLISRIELPIYLGHGD